MKKRMLALLLAVALVFSTLPVSVFADEYLIQEETVPVETTPEETEPQETVPEETEPEETEPQETEPQETEPEVTEPEETVPEETIPEETNPDEGIAPIDDTATETLDLADYMTADDAVYAVREQMLARNTAFSLKAYIEYDESYTEDILLTFGDSLVYAAVSILDRPDAGDYLANHCLGFVCDHEYTTDGTYYYFTVSFEMEYLTTAEQEAAVDKKVASILKSLALDDASDYEKAAGIYDYLTKNVTYNNNISAEADLLKLSAYGALVNKTANSYGIASAFYRLAGELGLYVGMMYGEVGSEGYCAWNTVIIDSYYYYADAAQDVGGTRNHFLKGTTTLTGHTPEPAYVELYGEYLSPIDYIDGAVIIGSCGESVYWALCTDNSLHIVGEGDMADYTYNTKASYAEYVDYIGSVVVEEGVTSIGAHAFEHFGNITEVTIADTVTRIGQDAFNYVDELTSITIPASVTEIGGFAFHGCTDLKEAIIHANITTIAGHLFTGCRQLTHVTLPDTVVSIGDYAFYGCAIKEMNWPSELTSIGLLAFSSCNFTSITLPDTVTSIGDSAFSGCSLLKTITLPSSLTNLGNSIFEQCSQLLAVYLPDSLSEIEFSLFSSCYNLKAVRIPASITSTDASDILGAFNNCDDLEHIFYAGTKEEWDQITAEADDFLPDVKVHCDVTDEDFVLEWIGTSCYGYCHICDKAIDFGPVDIAHCLLSMEQEVTYTGSNICPPVTLTVAGSKVLKEGTDYTLSYTNNKAVGTATVTITAAGECTGQTTATFTILPRQVQDLKVTSFSGTFIKISYGQLSEAGFYEIYVDGALQATTTSTSYTISDLTPGQTYEIWVVAAKTTGGETYRGQASQSVTAKACTDLSGFSAVLDAADCTYTGAAITPPVTVRKSSTSTPLVQDTDYTLSYSSNTELGNASVTVTGIGAYGGSIVKTFKILPAQVTGLEIVEKTHNSVTVSFDAVPGATEYWIYQGSTRKAKITGTTYTFTGLTAGTTYKFSVKANTNVEGADYTGAASETVSVRPSYDLSAGSLTVKYDTKVYTGKAITNTVTVKDADGKTVSSSNYTVTYENNVNLGQATVIVTGKGKYDGQLLGSFRIGPKAVSGVKAVALDGTSVRVTYTAQSGAAGYNIYANGQLAGFAEGTEYVVTGLTAGTTYRFTVSACAAISEDEMVSGIQSAAVSVTPKHNMSICTPVLSGTEFTYTGKAIKPTVTVYGYEDEVLIQGTDYTVSYVDSKNTGRAAVKITGKGAYTGTASEYYYIYPAQVTGLKLVATTATSVKVSWTKASTNSTKYYNVYVNGELAGRTTAGNYTIKNLTPGEVYSVYVIPEKTLNSGTYHGAASDTIEVRPGTYIGSYKVTLGYTKAVYEGEALCPAVVVKSSSKASATVLVKDVDYTVEYVANNTPGTASVIIRGINAYTGTITKTFTVTPAQVTGLEITHITHNSVTVSFAPVEGATEYWVYQGSTRKARITDTTYTFTGLTAGTTYKFSVKANGISGGKDYTGAASAKVSAKPVYRLEECSVTVKYDTKVYTGKALTNTFTVKGIDGKTIGSSYYTVAYENNVEMGTATVTITGKGKCIGQLQTTFNIGPKAVTGVKVTVLDGTSAKVTYSALSGISRYNIYVNGELAASTEGTEYVLTGLTAGVKSAITVRGVIYDGNGTPITGVASSAVSITPRHSMGICTLELEETEFVYNGSNQIPAFTVYGYEGEVLIQGTDYTVSFVDPKNTGRATVKITGKGAYTGSISQYYYIYPAQVTGLKVASATATSVKISWTKASTNSTKYYNVYVNGEKVGRTSGSSYTINNLTPGEVYSVYVIGEKTLASGTYYGAPSDTLEVRPA